METGSIIVDGDTGEPSVSAADGTPNGIARDVSSGSHVAVPIPKQKIKSRNSKIAGAAPLVTADERSLRPQDTPSVGPSRDEIEADKNALAEFRRILGILVQSSKKPPISGVGFWSAVNEFFNRRIYRLTSVSIYGRSLGYEELVGKYASLLPVLEMPSNLVHSEMALLGLLALQSERLSIAQSIFEEVRFLTSTATALVFVIRGVTRFVIFGGFIAFGAIYISFITTFLVVPIIVPFHDPSPSQIVAGVLGRPNVENVLCAIIFGCLGSVVSILLRLSEFETTKGRSREFLFLSGSTLPIVGGIFAAVVASLLASNLISFNFAGGSFNIWLYVVIGFLSGFSERFTRNLLSVAEGGLSPSALRGARDHQR